MFTRTFCSISKDKNKGKKGGIKKVPLPARRPTRDLGVDDGTMSCSTSWISFCLCNVYFETTRGSLEDSALSSRQAALSSSRQAADLRRNTFEECVVASRLGRSVPWSFSLKIYRAVSVILRPGRWSELQENRIINFKFSFTLMILHLISNLIFRGSKQ